MIIGIDPGKTGAMVASPPWNVFPMPLLNDGEVDYNHVRLWLEANDADTNNIFVIIEKQQVFPKQGAVSGAKIVGAYRELIGICRGLHLPFQIVRAQDWKKVVLMGRPWKGDKIESVRYVQERYPNINLMQTERCKKPSDGIADAVCMVEYGRWLLAGRPNKTGG